MPMPRAPARPWVATNEHMHIRMLARSHGGRRETGRHTSYQLPLSSPFFPFLPPFFPLRIRQGGGPSNPILPAARPRSVPKRPPIPSSTSTPVIRMIRMHSPPHNPSLPSCLTTCPRNQLFRPKIIQKCKIKVSVLQCVTYPNATPTGPPLGGGVEYCIGRRRAVKLN